MPTLQEFFQVVYKHSPDNKGIIAWGSVHDPAFVTLAEALADDVLSIAQDRDVFYSPAVLSAPRIKLKNVLGASVCWADVDDYKFDPPIPLLPPTIVVKSGRGKQLLWALDSFTKPQVLAAANKALSAHLKITGEGTHNPNRVLRVPGSMNCKYKQGKEGYIEPLPCEIIEFHPERVYDPADLYKLQPYDNQRLTTPALVDNPAKVDRHKRDYGLGLLLASWDLSERAIRAALLEISSKAQERVDYLDSTIRRVLADAPAHSRRTKQSKAKDPLANADFTATARLVDEAGAEIGISIMVTWDDNSVHIPARPADFRSRNAITDWLTAGGAGNRIFLGSDRQAAHLWASLVKACPTRTQLLVGVAGRHSVQDHNLLVYGPTSAMAYPANGAAPDVFWTPTITVESDLALGDPKAVLDKSAISSILGLVLQCQPPEVTQPALGWLALCPFKTVLEEMRLRLPVLMVYGFKGSGKTTYLQDVLLPLLGLDASPIAAELSYFSIIGHMSFWNAWPMWIDEFRATNKNATELEQLVRSLYDRSRVERGTPNRRVESYDLTSPLVVSGESPWYDAATAERTLAVQLQRRNVSQGTPYVDAFHRLRTWGYEHQAVLAREYLLWSLSKGRDDLAMYYEAGFNEFAPVLSGATDRLINNLAVVWAGLALFCDFLQELDLDVSITPDVGAFKRVALLTTNPSLGTLTYADRMVVRMTSLQDVLQLGVWWDPDERVLWFNLDKVSAVLHSKVDTAMLEMQLKERIGVYLLEPKRIPERGNSLHWGVDIEGAQELGLNVSAPASFMWATKSDGRTAIVTV
jgi:hypothetical protein